MAAELNVLMKNGELRHVVEEKEGNRELSNIEITDGTGHQMGWREVSIKMHIIHL